MSVTGEGKVRHKRVVLDMAITGATADALVTLASQDEVQPINWPEDKLLDEAAFIGQGRFFTPSEVLAGADVCVLGHQTALDLFEGDNPLDEVVWVNRRRCLVIGVLAELEVLDPSLRNRMRPNEAFYLPTSTAIHNLFEEEPSVQITARVRDETRMAEAKEQVAAYLRQRHGVEKDEQGEYKDDFNMTHCCEKPANFTLHRPNRPISFSRSSCRKSRWWSRETGFTSAGP
jgi:hypothetical protein